jgi:hypothetical protein
VIPKEIKKALVDIKNRTQKTKRKCLYENCNETAISSHLLQRNGIINQISESSLVYKMVVDPYRSGGLKFKLLGLKDAFSFSGFCSVHDNNLFKEIEGTSIDFSNYKTSLLFCYRALVNEKRKKEMNLDFDNRVLNSFSLKFFLADEYLEQLEKHKKGDIMGLTDSEYYERKFLLNLNDPSRRDFAFHLFEIPKIDICVSGVFSYETTAEVNELHNSYLAQKPLTDIYINIIPQGSKSVVIFGCLENTKEKCWDYITSFDPTNIEGCMKSLSDLLMRQVENWLCSPSFYRTNIKAREREINTIWNESLRHEDERRPLPFNLFEV